MIKSRLRSIFLWSGITLAALVGLAVAGRVFFADYFPPLELYKSSRFDPYMVEDATQPTPHYRLRPGFSFTVEQAIQDRTEQGRELSVAHLTSSYQHLGYELNQTIFTINSNGFKGPEIDPQHHHRPRILTLGDSCTFGSLFDRYSYPRSLERTLQQRGLNVEVINAGVEGYSPFNIKYEVPTYLALQPEIVTIYTGWNALYRQSLDVDPGQPALESYWGQLFRRAKEGFVILAFGKKRYALWQYYKDRRPDKDAEAIKLLERYSPPVLLEVEELAKTFQANGSKVVLMTIPGIYLMEEKPSQLALSKGHLPPYTQNPYVLAKITERYNQGIREMAQRLGAQLVDLDAWSRTALIPRDVSFIDSVHLREEDQERLGEFLASQLFPSRVE